MRVEKSSAGAVSGSDDVAASTTFESSSSFHSISSQPPTLLTLNHPLLPHPPTPFYPSQCPSSLVSSSSSVCLGCGRHTRLTSPQLSRPLAGPPSPSLSSTTPQGKGAVGGADPKGASEESQRPGSFLLSLLLSLSGYLIHCVILTSNPPPPLYLSFSFHRVLRWQGRRLQRQAGQSWKRWRSPPCREGCRRRRDPQQEGRRGQGVRFSLHISLPLCTSCLAG